MGLFSLANLFGITLRESANDGSDFTNPDADYRRVFLGEDGALHARDSSGTVTTLGGATDHGALTGLTDDDHTQYLKETDVSAKGDIYVASANDTVGVLSAGTNGHVLTLDSSQSLGVKWAAASVGALDDWGLMTEAGAAFVSSAAQGAANRHLIVPCRPLLSSQTIAGVAFRVNSNGGTGNTMVSLYDSSLNRLAVSGSATTPANGQATQNFTSGYGASAGVRYYLGLWCSSNSPTFAVASGTSTAGPMHSLLEDNAGGPQTTFTSGGASPIVPSLIGIISGKWTP